MSRAIRNSTVLSVEFLFLFLVVFNAVPKVVATAASGVNVLLHKLLQRTVRLELNRKDSLLELEWSLPLDECHDYKSGVWLRINDKSSPIISSSKQQLQILNEYIPEQCLTRNADTWSSSYVISYGNESTSNNGDDSCHHSALAGHVHSIVMGV